MGEWKETRGIVNYGGIDDVKLVKILRGLCERIDSIEGLRGTIKFNDAIDLGGNYLTDSGKTINIDSDIDMREHKITNVAGGVGLPIGSIIMYPVPSPLPEGFLLCSGQRLSVDDYPDLFAIIGYKFGGGLGIFNLPDARQRYTKIGSTEDDINITGGAATHTHDDHAAKNTGEASAGATEMGSTASTLTLQTHTHSISAYTHAASNHEPPYLTMFAIIKAK